MKKIIFATSPGSKPALIETYLYNYDLDLSKKGGGEKWIALQDELMAQGLERFEVWPSYDNGCNKPDRPIMIETDHIFGNQWNTAPDETNAQGHRVFNWYLAYRNQCKSLKTGHYLKITEEMIDLVKNTFNCGYCGAEYYGAENAGKFCSACLDSEYLKETELFLLRLKSGDLRGSYKINREKLTPEEEAEIMPCYIKRQTTGKTSRNANKLRKDRDDIEKKMRNEIADAKTERDGLIWLMDRNISVDNVLFYSHTGRFCFGWRSPVGDKVRAALLEKLADFPFSYDIK